VEIASSSNELSEASARQASALQQTVAAIDEINAMVNKNAETAKLSADVSNASEASAITGKNTVQGMVQAISHISDANTAMMNEINHSNEEISEIVKVIAEIGNKTKVINDIVFQTKLLSFNASVEAARAGEHGKGFAVVAEEVGNLAQMSGNAAKEISSMLDSSIQKVERIVEQSKTKVSSLMQTGKETVDSGIRTAQDCGRVLDDILANVTRVNQMVVEISTASQEQAMGVQEVTKAMNQLDQVTQQNLGTAQQSSTSAEHLNGRSEGLKNVSFELLELIGADQATKKHSA
jgi:methyl-accepting chemotaxis protein